jgi:hypothetical protein
MDLYDQVTTALQKGIALNLKLLLTYRELAADLASLDMELRRVVVQEDH